MKTVSERDNKARVKLSQVSAIVVSAVMLMKKATGILKRTMFVAFLLVGCIGMSATAWAELS
ncbi:MAG: hypothetical protein BWK80_43270, partial [Desulfobacteraceae bacterium IS3]